ncbi:MAG: hypothetical protein WA989_16760 [Henriciella sp.]|uniref:hypothetical protein n=1 Tax=Henriciella sp. TaxID=1968823 RepID=UPI003C754A95
MSTRPKYITNWTYTSLMPETKEKKVKVQVGTETVEKKSLLGGSKAIEQPQYETRTEKVETGNHINTMSDIGDLADRLENMCNTMHADGYDVISVIPVQFGNFNTHADKSSMQQGHSYGFGWGYGFGLTRGVIVTGKDRAES